MLIEREVRANGASVRNFGFITVTGQERGESWRLARRTRDVWADLAPRAGIAIEHRGLYLTARSPEAVAVIEAFLPAQMDDAATKAAVDAAVAETGASATAPGLEALVRWQHPVRGSMAPGEFIDIAEESGLIHGVGELVLLTACRQFVDWQRRLGAQAPSSMAVNLSRAQLRDPGWVARLGAQLTALGMRPEQLHLELTESLAAQDSTIQRALRDLKALGVIVALDDFGTGYSSLSSLHLFPVDTDTIDRSFKAQVESSPHHKVLIEATVMVARSLGMRTVAEGIETPGQFEAARSSGCDAVQGYLFSVPLVAADCEAWLLAWQPPGD